MNHIVAPQKINYRSENSMRYVLNSGLKNSRLNDGVEFKKLVWDQNIQ